MLLLLLGLLGLLEVCSTAPDVCGSAGIQSGSLQAVPKDGAVRLTWSPSSTPNCVDNYEIEIFEINNGETIPLENKLTIPGINNATGVEIGDLKNGATYLFNVTASNQFGNGTESVEVTLATNQDQQDLTSGPMQSPEDLVVVNSNDSPIEPPIIGTPPNVGNISSNIPTSPIITESPADPVGVNPNTPTSPVITEPPEDPVGVNSNTLTSPIITEPPEDLVGVNPSLVSNRFPKNPSPSPIPQTVQFSSPLPPPMTPSTQPPSPAPAQIPTPSPSPAADLNSTPQNQLSSSPVLEPPSPGPTEVSSPPSPTQDFGPPLSSPPQNMASPFLASPPPPSQPLSATSLMVSEPIAEGNTSSLVASPSQSSVIPQEVGFLTTRCESTQCCLSWRASLMSTSSADYFVVGVEYRQEEGLSLLTGSGQIDYTAGLKFANGFDEAGETCVIFDGLETGEFYRFQVVGVNDAGFGPASRWSIGGRTRESILGVDCGCSTASIDTPPGFELYAFQQAFPGFTG